MTVAAGAVGIEALEALAIVLAVGVERRMRDALIGAAAAVVAVVALGAAVGPALLSGADLSALRLVVGTLLLLFGLEWLRKGILRMAGLRRRARRTRSMSTSVRCSLPTPVWAAATGRRASWRSRACSWRDSRSA